MYRALVEQGEKTPAISFKAEVPLSRAQELDELAGQLVALYKEAILGGTRVWTFGPFNEVVAAQSELFKDSDLPELKGSEVKVNGEGLVTTKADIVPIRGGGKEGG